MSLCLRESYQFFDKGNPLGKACSRGICEESVGLVEGSTGVTKVGVSSGVFSPVNRIKL